MIGLLEVKRENISNEDAILLSSSYCGVCKSLRHSFGEIFGCLVNYDARFLVLLVISQSGNSKKGVASCPVKAYLGKQSIITDKCATDFAAAISMLVFTEKLKDDIRDSRLSVPTSIFRFPSSIIRKTNAILDGLGFPLEIIDQTRAQQLSAESSYVNISTYLEPTATLLGEVFAHTSILSNLPQQSTLLRELGKTIGHLIVLIDATEDLYYDIKYNKFNPIVKQWNLQRQQYLPIKVLSELCLLFSEQFCILQSILEKINFVSNDRIIGNILTGGLPQRASKALSAIWHRNHWIGDFPSKYFEPLHLTKCPKCGLPHIRFPSNKSVRTNLPSLWSSSLTLPTAPEIMKELGINCIEEYMLVCMFPTFIYA